MLAIERDIIRPQGGVQHQAAKIFLALETGGRGVVELADGAYKRGRFENIFAIFGFQRRNPAPFAFVPPRRRELRAETYVAANIVFQRYLPEIVEQFLALREIAGPWVARTERKRIRVIWRIDAAARVAVDIPGAAELIVLLDDGIGDAETAERDAKRDGADACADDQDVVLLQLFAGWFLCPACVARDEPHFLAHHRRIFRRDLFAKRGAHHLQHKFVAGIGDHRLGLAVCKQLQDGGADFILDFAGG